MREIIALKDISLDTSPNSYLKTVYYNTPTDLPTFALRIYLTNNKPIYNANLVIKMLGQTPPSDVITIKSHPSSELYYDSRIALTGRANQYNILLPTISGKFGVVYVECDKVISNTVNFFAGIF